MVSMMTKTTAAAATWNEELVSEKTGLSRGTVKVKQTSNGLLALIGSRWCKVAHLADGRLVEVWTR